MKLALAAAVAVFVSASVTSTVHAQRVFFEKYAPGQILPVDSLLFLDNLQTYSQFKVTEPAATVLTPLAQIVNDPSGGGRGNELLLQDGAGLLYKNNAGWIGGGFRFTGILPLPPALGGSSVEINGETRGLAELVATGSGFIGGMSFMVTPEPSSYYRLKLGIASGSPPQFGQMFRIDSGVGQLTLDEVGVGYLPEPSAGAIACAVTPLALLNRRKSIRSRRFPSNS